MVLGLLVHVTPSNFFRRILKSEALVYKSFFFSEQPFYGNYSTLDSHTRTVISHAFAYSSRWRRKSWQGLCSLKNITESNSILISINHRFAKVCGKALWHLNLATHCPIDVKNIMTKIICFFGFIWHICWKSSRLRSPGFGDICFKHSRFAWFSWKVRKPHSKFVAIVILLSLR